MKIILTTSLFFCLTLTTILAQVVRNISAPNSSDVSTHSVDDFDVNSDGIILNNSAIDGIAQLGAKAVDAHPNITAGSEASLILFQVTGTSGSDLDGTIEVFGGEAGLIIANPNGIACDGCAFTNVNRVDLVTGSGYDAGTNTFSTIAATDITIEGDALEISNVDLNIQTGRDFSNDVAINVDTLNITAGADFKNAGAIVAETVTIDVTNFVNDIKNSGTISATSLNIILTDTFNSSSTSFNAFSFRNLDISTEGTFINQSALNLDNLTIKTGVNFDNQGEITADSLTAATKNNFQNNFIINVDSLTVTAGAYLNNLPYATINAISFTATVEETFNNLVSSVINTTNLTVTAKKFNTHSTSTIDAATLTIEVPNFASNISHAGTISAASLNFILTADFTHESDSFTGFTNFSNLAITTDGAFTNNDTIDLDGNLTITANSFANSGGVVNVDALAVSVTGDFNYEGTITANAYNLNIGGDFSYNDSANDFILGVNDILTVLGEASIDVAGFENSGTITVTNSGNFTANTFSNSGTNTANSINITVAEFTNSGTISAHTTLNTTVSSTESDSFNNTGGVLDAATFALNVAGDFDYEGTITASTYNLDVGGDFSYDDSASDFTWGDSDTLTVSGSSNITAAGFENSGTITVTNRGNFTANTFSNTGTVSAATITIGVTNFDDDITNSGNVSATSLNFILTDDFTHTSDSFSAFNNFINLAITTDGTFTNNATINPTGNLTITANTFNNTGGVVNADALTVSVAGDFDYGSITASTYDLNVDGDFSYNDSASNFILGLNDTLTVLGSANIVAADFNNSGTIAVTGSLGITAAGFDNSSIIRASSNFDITATGFDNSGTISTSSIFNVTVGDFINRAGARITAAECNFVHTSFADEGTIACLNSDTIEATVDNIEKPDGSGFSNNNYETFHIPRNGVVFNNSDSDVTSQLLGEVPANPNYTTSGDAASIILAQVTSLTDISLLLGTLEVVGAEAVVIIANPNGIDCNACSFINASRVDLVTGSNYNFDADSFDSIANTNITITDNGLDAADVGILNIRAGSFTNTGVLEANDLNLNVNGDFDYTQRGIINATSFNLEVGGDFSNNDESIGFVWEELDTLTVSGSANITALNFINHGTIDITDSASGSFEITTGYTAINQGSIASDILTINAADFFRNLTGGNIAVASLNIIAGGKVTNTATIDVTGTLTITANNDSSRTNDRTGFYVSNRGNITATTLNIEAVDNFYNRGNITADNFNITSAKSVFLLNEEINSFYAAGYTYDGGNISLNGDSSFIADGIIENYGNIISLNGNSRFIADGGSIQNYGHIDLGDNILDISADSFTNHADATIDAATLNLAVTSYINDGSVDVDEIVSDTTIDQ